MQKAWGSATAPVLTQLLRVAAMLKQGNLIFNFYSQNHKMNSTLHNKVENFRDLQLNQLLSLKEQHEVKCYQNNHTSVYRYLRKLQPLEIVIQSFSLWRALLDLLPAAGSPWAFLICHEDLTLAFSNAWKLHGVDFNCVFLGLYKYMLILLQVEYLN